ncbi:disks large-associated protein 5 isoform X1 [Micropterus salmoides]|uniref:disks large-associated protein 5 isoform X1 n=1 Tax=Micropterus salmoides TaxID=27706 RepID=UPI0018EC1C20|nr:disks large-associated protein 5 isoform X1 [Micropterus salmoides]
MESRFAHLRQRDTSASMLRVKMSRRRSQSQKENRERTVNTRRQLDKLPELDISSLDASIAMANMSTIQEKTQNNAKFDKNKAGEERLKQLARWKERKALEKEKEKRERERKGVFKTGVYHPRDTLTIVSLPAVPAASTRATETQVNTAPSQSTRVTRSMKQQHQVQRPLKMQDPNTVAKKAQPAVERPTRSRVAPVKPAPAKSKTKMPAVEPVVQALSTRTANRPPVTAAPVVKDKPKDKSAGVRTTRSRALVQAVAPLSETGRNCKAPVNTVQPAVPKEAEPKESELHYPEEKPHPPSCSEEDDMVVEQAPADSIPAVDPIEAPSSISSFAPEGFVFQAPTGLSSFKFEPLTPRSADVFLTPSPSFILPEAPTFNLEPQAEQSKPLHSKSPRTSPTVAPPNPGSPLESKHDVTYFRLEIANETDRLITLCGHWEPKVEDESIPEEMRDRMRTAVGQARLLMKERFKQFSGLVDDCELCRGEKITTCTDLQGFWDMVYYQVEDVNKKFDALKEAESRGWVEEHKPPPRQRKAVKKPSAAPAKPTGATTAAKSRLAAVKAAMKARQQAAEKAAKDAGNIEDNPSPNSREPQPQTEVQPNDTVVFDGGFFHVESPAKPPGSVRRSIRLSAAVLHEASPSSNYLSPRRITRRSLAMAQTPVHTPAHLRLTLIQTPAQAPKSQNGTPHSSQNRKDNVNESLCFSPVKEVLSDNTQPEGSPAQQSETVSPQGNAVPEWSTPTPGNSLPSISIVEEQDEPAEAVDVDLPVSPRLSLSPHKTPIQASPAPEPSSRLSFMLSPCVTPSQAAISFPLAVQGPVDAQGSVCHTPDSSAVEEIPGLDKRYFQPLQRCSMSPNEKVAIDTLSPMAVDVEMESPRGQSEDLLAQEEPALPAVSSVLTLKSPQAQTAESALLLFTPDLKDRIRQSVCPSDLMVFTPPL